MHAGYGSVATLLDWPDLHPCDRSSPPYLSPVPTEAFTTIGTVAWRALSVWCDLCAYSGQVACGCWCFVQDSRVWSLLCFHWCWGQHSFATGSAWCLVFQYWWDFCIDSVPGRAVAWWIFNSECFGGSFGSGRVCSSDSWRCYAVTLGDSLWVTWFSLRWTSWSPQVRCFGEEAILLAIYQQGC